MTKREKTIAICVGAAAGLLALDQWLLQPYFDRLSKADALIEQHQSALDDAQNIRRTQTAAMKKWKAVAHNLVTADSTAAERQLTNRVSEAANQARLSISGSKAEKIEKEKGYDRYGYKPSTTGNMEQITRFLYQLQTADIPLRVNDLTISSRRDGQNDLTLALSLSTIYQSPATANRTAVAGSFGGTR